MLKHTVVTTTMSLCLALAAPAAAQAPRPDLFAPGAISGPANDLSPAFTPDGRTVFFTRANAMQSTIVVSRLSAGRWSTPEIAPFSGEWSDLEAAMAPDGSYLIFASNRPTAPGGKPLDAFYNGAAQPGKGGNLWRVDRTARGWSAPRRLPDVVNASTSIYSPSIAADGSLYFMQPTGAQARFHLFRAAYTNGAYAAPVPVDVGAAEDVGDFDPAVAPDESFLVFSSARLPAKGTSLFITFRERGAWTAPTYLGDTVSAPGAGNIEARLGADARTLYFSSTRVVPTPLNDRAASARSLALMAAWNNGLANVWRVSLDAWLPARGAR
ncbi:MAG: TolB family protein [Gemmatimonadaceae bacterium]